MTTDYIVSCLDGFRSLKHGWYDGQGDPMYPAGLDWLVTQVKAYCNPLIPKPGVCPDPNGCVVFEWHLPNRQPSLEINLHTGAGYWHGYDTATKDAVDKDMVIDGPAFWQWLSAELGRFVKATTPTESTP